MKFKKELFKLDTKKILGVVIIVLGILSGVIFFVAGSSVGKAGDSMTELKSQAGTSLAEAYYQEVGEFAKGISTFIYGLGLAVITFSIGLGGKMVISVDVKDELEEKEIDLSQLPEI